MNPDVPSMHEAVRVSLLEREQVEARRPIEMSEAERKETAWSQDPDGPTMAWWRSRQHPIMQEILFWTILAYALFYGVRFWR